MDFNLTREQELVRQMVREFAENEVKPIAAEIDETERFPMENVKKMGQYGMMGIPFSKEYGGAGGDVLSYIIAVEELSKVCGTTGVILSAHTSLCASLINEHGTEEQKQKYLVPLAKGEKIGAYGLTEPNAGTDSGAQQTVAVLEGDHYVINGSKIFITNGGVADTFVIFAMTDRTKGTKGISAFIIEKGFKGFSIGKVEQKLGIRASSTTELVFEDMIVPVENMIGKEGKGFPIAMKTLDGGRIGIAAQALGIAEGAFNEARAYMKERKQFGRSLDKFQGLAWMMADMDVAIESARYLVYKAAYLKQAGLPYTVDAARAKLHAANVAMDVTTKAVQLFGGYGYTKDYPVERMMRDAKITEIYEGTSEVQKLVISGKIFR
ncbi:butyryl-CoA dehydrogenase [Clostridium acetobutylicum]|jgi:butyryl-CoA dehydrogenase|uniref:Acyl-CoA dehydrogenase, short-chain specific n=1 Tax=Clostridium acetobutylicum (strain ATCC 824 / DSM 792 / JCM 1419 / IAM 19013 / LMG 5710 / NBRC 13948 / NRRL B-527 / VKM B-1787 / 2291 / W) TaxID=272562 RepID=ACDS_CLOAB|nr:MULTISPECIES: acyl-CoA dehydrogenase [Clostridium]P52042.1 RecName: Full=Acyl-CoA dehydrogenase, short-chain specific; AltName: Full=Butyryl-CoA dehydrogenase; AltName: Full=SCAD [Clostridium acetobutylicum ATCC 824]AAA95968.1 putative butyryl-CoA dehydrogenase [Clostridium acetobutylicum ATCC 824]AAK80657.1 Butyryl-CoA dehydrogenase [Clostridium acetobutylicum ATCC 824]ADZ21756.1 Butyryl-CoA dehydrogenase [Clostridium acetobutylicum EA 2018]AEI33941.1 butyryl-CoA dehydrogenase [Clostridium